MNTSVELAADGATLVVRIPMKFRRAGGRKQIMGPDGSLPLEPVDSRPNTPLQKALGRAFHWRRMLEAGDHLTLGDLAKAQRVTVSYVSRVLRLTLLAPDIVDAILEGRMRPSFQRLMRPLPLLWHDQRQALSPSPLEMGRSSRHKSRA